ncbi:hypothetical protein LTR09_004280 [Extremus antarcticus]|uniref:Carrier domain-containing protein n=1 Tax=Extremus antarcticus TaxID=702011 RepID=A0AAJ0DI50_9PEZI|nr:hypothetical protein LTR09_004280 [Extremus antarcticus]
MAQQYGTHDGDLLLVPNEDVDIYLQYIQHAASSGHGSRSDILKSIPCQLPPSYGPMATLSALLSTSSGPWTVLELQLAHTRCWKALPNDAKAGRGSQHAQQLVERTLVQCKQSYTSLLDLLHSDSFADAIIDPGTRRSIRHNALADSIRNFSQYLPSATSTHKPIVALSLPNGPLLALAVTATATYCTAAPLAHGSGVGAEQFKSDVLQSGARIVVASKDDVSRLGLLDPWLKEANIGVLLVELTPAMDLYTTRLNGATAASSLTPELEPNTADDTAILLFTSGTSGTKKLVPLSVHSLVCGVAMVVDSWGLSPSMRCLNQMPLNHVGGLVRNLFAPILSGGSVICCSAFDAQLFWDCVEDYEPTWYYASPSMHQCILDDAEDRPVALSKSQIQLVCNAAGGLLPSLASRLQNTFQCTVLPSYGMTECMPISTPPQNYRLEKPGTSGVSAGPDIAVLDGNDDAMGPGAIGRIAVRGLPVFAGYLKGDDMLDTSCFTDDGWFDTGDMGYLDKEGYLYLTGRSKEVINRGGELISPFEVEEAVVATSMDPASPTYGKVSKALAFSVPHDVLQEVVGVCIVTPPGASRTCLRHIQSALKDVLALVKIPTVVVFMDGGLPTNNNKVLRIRLAERLCLPELSDTTTFRQRHFEASCSPQNTPLASQIQCQSVESTPEALKAAYRDMLPGDDLDMYVRTDDISTTLFVAPLQDKTTTESWNADSLMESLVGSLHSYQIPAAIHILEHPLPRTMHGRVYEVALDHFLQPDLSNEKLPSLTQTEQTVASVFAQVLNIQQHTFSNDSDFFLLGGDSMRAGRLLSLLRREFKARLTIDMLFSHSTIASLAALLDDIQTDPVETTKVVEGDASSHERLLPGCENTCSSTHPLVMAIQLLPICLFYPMKRAFTWTVFIYSLSWSLGVNISVHIPGRLLVLVVSMFIARTVTRILAPIITIIFKWVVIGRYKEGLYPMWGRYHTRWWLCQKTIQVTGMGMWGTFNWSRCLYYRALGAKIGKNVTLNKGTVLGEYDLLTIEDGVNLERCTVRPFAAERNTSMYLGRIILGRDSSVGLGSIVAAGTSLPPYACIGPNSSSWEVDDASEANRDLASGKIPGAHWALTLFIGLPLQFASMFVGALPWLGCLAALVANDPKFSVVDPLRSIIVWFATPDRVGLHYAALAANAALGPLFFFAAVLAIKKIFDLCLGPTRRGHVSSSSQMTKFRRQLIRTLMPVPRFHKLTELFGAHYEATSIFMRAMGAKVGKHVYWPGTGPSIQDYDLLEVGDDVVFGSRSHLVTSDATGSESIRIRSGAMVADRVILLPGVTLGEKTVMGSGALTKRNAQYADETTWVGSKKGEGICLSTPTPSVKKGSLASTVIPTSFNSSSTTLAAKHNELELTDLPALERSHNHLHPLDGPKAPFTYMDISSTRTSMTLSRGEETVLTSPPNPTTSPFGRAFYQKKTTYRVWTQFEIFLYSTLTAIATAIYWNIGSISGTQVIAYIMHHNPAYLSKLSLLTTATARPLAFYGIFLAWTIVITTAQSVLVLGFLVAAKWVLMGRRNPGNHSWDTSSYCQRWQLYLKLESLRRNCYGGAGILGLFTGTHYMTLYFRALGASIGKDCALFAGGLPSLLFTEPDLLTLGDRVSVDDVSLVAHINTRGKFDLNPLVVGDRCVLRSGSRLLSGARMEEDSCLLEHTLVMAGDVVKAGTTIQGWPGEEFKAVRMPTLRRRVGWGV